MKSRRIKERDGKGAEGRGADESQDRGDMRVESLREPVQRRSGDSGGCTAKGRVVRVLCVKEWVRDLVNRHHFNVEDQVRVSGYAR